MKSFTINGTKRAAHSKQEIKKLRAEGMVLCVLYGGKEQVHFSTPALALKGLVYSPDVHTVQINVDGTGYHAIMKEIQFHPVSDKIQHIDFLEIRDDKEVIIDIPVRVTGTAVGVRAGGQLLTKMRKLKISSLPKNLPDQVVLKADDLNIGDSIRVRDLKIDGVEFLDSGSNVITAVKTTRIVVEEPVAAAATTETPAAGAAAPGTPGAAPAAAAPAAKEEKKK